MPRPVTIRDEAIIQAARDVFLEDGFAATTAAVAARAGVSEGSIFKRFATKVELFQTAMRPRIEALEWLNGLAERVGQGSLRDQLVRLGVEGIAFFRTVMPLIMMTWSNQKPCAQSGALPAVLQEPNPPPIRAMKRLTAYFAAEIRAGRLRRHDPQVLARMFLGTMQNYVFFDIVLRAHDERSMPSELYVREVVDVLLTGTSAELSPVSHVRVPQTRVPRARASVPARKTAAKRRSSKRSA